jgi:hypothetical protein
MAGPAVLTEKPVAQLDHAVWVHADDLEGHHWTFPHGPGMSSGDVVHRDVLQAAGFFQG